MKRFVQILLIFIFYQSGIFAQCPPAASVACSDNSNSACPELYQAFLFTIDTINATQADIYIDLNWTRCSASNASIEYQLLVGDPADFDGSYASATCFGPITNTMDCGTISIVETVNLSDLENLYIASRGRTNGSCGGTTCETVIVLVESPLLPVKLTSFEIREFNEYVRLSWSTEFEIQNEGFVVQRSSNNIDFTDLEFISGNGNSIEENHYTYIDRRPFAGVGYYRLIQKDFDGNYSISIVRSINTSTKSKFKINAYPNPLKDDQLNIQVGGDYSADILVTNNHGKTMSKVNAVSNLYRIDTRGWSSGIYWITVVSGTEVETKKIVKI